MDNRIEKITQASGVGIVLNLCLVIVKAVIGIMSGSVSVLTDAVNNATDALSSTVTLIGAKLAQRKPDREHPHGHGRIEYVAQIVVGVIIFAVGVVAIVQSVPKIEKPELANYSVMSLIVIVATVLLKFWLAQYFRRVGKETKSGSLRASGMDALFDALLTLGTLVGAGVSMAFGVSIDGWVGVVISAFILKSAVKIIYEGMRDVIGRRVDDKVVRKVREMIRETEGVKGIEQLVLHDYGPGEISGAVKVEVSPRMDVKAFKKLAEEIETKVAEELGVKLIVGM